MTERLADASCADESCADEICIVGYGAILPDATDPQAFWENLITGRCSIRELPEERWPKDRYCTETRDDNRSSSHQAGFIAAPLLAATAHRLGLSLNDHNRLQIMALAATEQALSGLDPGLTRNRRADLYLGCTEVDEGVAKRKFMAENFTSLVRHVKAVCGTDAERVLDLIRRHLTGWEVDSRLHRGELFTTSLLALIQRRFGFSGEAALIDAACASSLTALDVGMRVLRSGRAELVVAGGVESNLGPDTFVLFSRLGALAAERCLPLDRRSEGLSQGEGAVVFVLERLADAKRHGHPVRAILKSCGSASDGRSASLFEPTVEGQLRALRRAYQEVDPRDVDYLECHATGTPVGDAAELRSVRRFFGDRRLPIGSVKSLIGHTKGAAGAVSLLKCLLALEHRTAPPSPYFQSPILGESAGPYVNREPIRWHRRRKLLTCGVSAFGFGGINYHLVVQEPARNGTARGSRSRRRRRRPEPLPEHQVILVAQHYRPLVGIRQADRLRTLRIPPSSRQQIDELQLAALLAVVETLEAFHVDLTGLSQDSVAVIAASTIGLEAAADLSHRVRHAEIRAALAGREESLIARVLAHQDRYPPVTEDTGPGILNNVLAGRIANHFDFTGPSFNVDADLASYAVALRLAELFLTSRNGDALVILLSADESFDAGRFKVDRRGVTCSILTTLALAKDHDLPIQAVLEGARQLSASAS